MYKVRPPRVVDAVDDVLVDDDLVLVDLVDDVLVLRGCTRSKYVCLARELVDRDLLGQIASLVGNQERYSAHIVQNHLAN